MKYLEPTKNKGEYKATFLKNTYLYDITSPTHTPEDPDIFIAYTEYNGIKATCKVSKFLIGNENYWTMIKKELATIICDYIYDKVIEQI